MLTTPQLKAFYLDLQDDRLTSALGIVHSRFSTNTFPSWPLAHPFRRIAHNGEINTVTGNENWMRAREALIRTEAFGTAASRENSTGQDLDKIVPGLYTGRVRHRAVRRGARVVASRRPQPAARRADDDPGGVGTASVDGSGAAGVLPVPLLADGAVGRPGLDDVHRRHRDRRGAGPQRPSPVPHLGHQRRSGRDGLRGRRAQPRPVHGREENASAARPHVPGRHGAGPHRRRRGDQGRAGRRAPISGVARRRPVPPRRAAAGRLHPHAASPGRVAPAGFRLHLRGAQPAGGADGPHRRRAARLDGHRHPGGSALAAAPDALRLLPAAVRSSHQPAVGRHPRRGGDQPAGHRRAGGRPAQPDAGVVSPDCAAAADPAQPRAGRGWSTSIPTRRSTAASTACAPR